MLKKGLSEVQAECFVCRSSIATCMKWPLSTWNRLTHMPTSNNHLNSII